MEPVTMEMLREMLKDVRDEVKSVKKILTGNGEIGLIESHRDLEQRVNAMSIRVRAAEEKIEPLVDNQEKKSWLKDLAKQVAMVLITISPFFITAFIWANKIWVKLNTIVPLETVVPK